MTTINPAHPRVRFFQPHHEEEIAQMYSDGLSINKIAQEIGSAFGTVRRVLVRQGTKLRGQGSHNGLRQLAGEELERTIWLYEQGLSHRQTGAILGVSESTVRDRLQKSRKRLGRPRTKRQGCYGRAGEPKTIPLHVRRAAANWAGSP